MGLDDEVFVARCLEGDQAAFTCLVSEYKEMVYAYAYHKLGDCQQAEDITQEVFIKAYRNLAQLKWPHKFRSWLYTIASNECKLWLREHSREREREVFWEDVPVENLNELAVRNHSDEDINLTVKSAMETLSDDRQLALTLFYMSGLSVTEIAYFMGISSSNVRVKLHRARKQLGERLEKMIGKQLSKERLKAGFVFKVVDSIRDMPIPSLPKPRPMRWAPIPISIGIALLIGVIGYGFSSGRDIPQDMRVLKLAETTYEVSLLPDLDEQADLDIKTTESELAALDNENDAIPEAEGNPKTGIVVRKVEFSNRVMGGVNIAPSPDGRYLSYASSNSGNLAVYDLTTGESRDITDDATWYGAQSHAIDLAWSPDGKQVACRWAGGGHSGLRIARLDGSQPRDLYSTVGSPDLRIEGCYDWSRDGKYILVTLGRKDDKDKWMMEIGLVSVADGSLRILKAPVADLGDPSIKFSPDGRYIVYDRPVKEHEGLSDIFLLTTDGSGEETRLTEHPAADYRPIWSPDGKAIVFVSNREPGGAKGIWLIHVADGKPVGEPQLTKREAGNIWLLEFTRKGSLYYTTTTRWSYIYVTSLDVQTGELMSHPELLPSQAQDLNTMPTWSPDGKRLAYVSVRTPPGSFRRRPVLVIRSMETGKEQELLSKPIKPGYEIGGHLRWSPDGRSILYGWPWDPHRIVDVQTGRITEIPKTDSRIWNPVWSPDCKTIYYTGVELKEDDWPSRIVAFDLETRQERELYSGGKSHSAMAVSPDGGRLAFCDKVLLDETSEKLMLRVMPTVGGEPRTLFEDKDLDLEGAHLFAPFAWTSDGRYVLLLAAKDGPSLWRIPAEGGEPKKLPGMGRIYDIMFCPLSLHPDGKRIAFQRGQRKQVDLWAMENFMPTSKAIR